VTLSNEGVHPYLWGETAYTGHTDALLISAEGASIKASRIFLAAASPVMKRILQSEACCGEETVKIHVQAGSQAVLQLIHFIHTGYVYSTTKFPSQDLAQLCQSIGVDGLSHSELVSSEEDKLCDAPDLSVYYATEDDLKNPKSEAPSALLQTVLNEVKVEDATTTSGGGYENYNDWDDNGYGDQVDNNYDPTVPEVQEEQEEEYESDDEWKPLAKKMRKGRKGGEIDENGYVGKKRKPPKRLNPSNNGSAKRSAASYRRKLVKGPDGTPVPKDALFYFPQYGEKDMTRPYECHRCVRLFSLEFDLKQHLLRHDRESNKENLFCLECTNLPEGKKTWFEVEADYVAHVKEFHDESFKRSRSEESKSCYFHFPQTREKDTSYEHKCLLCIRAFKTLNSLEQHLRRHTNYLTPKEPFACLKCNRLKFKTCKLQEKHQHKCDGDPAELPLQLQEVYRMHNIVKKKLDDGRTAVIPKYLLVDNEVDAQSGGKYLGRRVTPYKKHSERNISSKGVKALGWEAIKDMYRTESMQKYFFFFPQPGEKDMTKPNQCPKCVRKFELEDDLWQHLRRHDAKNESEVYFCLKCENTSFPDEREYVDHMEKCDPAWVFKTIKEGSSNNEDQLKYFFHFPRTEEENITFPWKCKLCIRTFRHKKKFELHLRRHVSSQTIDEAFSCLICHQELFRSWGAWKAHEKQCKGSDLPMPEHIFNVYDQHGLLDPVQVEMAACPGCGKIFSSRNKLKYHIQRMGKYHLQCGSCDYRITDNGQYQKHISEEHGGSVGTRCLECGDSFSNKFVLLEHMQREHDKFKRDNVLSREKHHICDVCGKELKSQFNLDHHMATLHGDKELTCPQCPKDNRNLCETYTSLAHLKQHQRKVHAKKFTCDLCGYTTARSKSYDIHVLKEHTPNAERPFTCSYCNKGFFEKALYKDHLNIHTGERPYVCKLCNASFASQGNYGAHMRQTHRGIKRKK